MAQRMVSKKTLSRKNRKPRRAKVMPLTTLRDSSAEQYLTLEQVEQKEWRSLLRPCRRLPSNRSWIRLG